MPAGSQLCEAATRTAPTDLSEVHRVAGLGLAWALGAQGVNPALGTGLLTAMLGTSTVLRRGILRIAA